MALSESLVVTLSAVVSAAEEHGEPAVNPWVIGGGAFAILLLLLLGLIAFGGGRDHS